MPFTHRHQQLSDFPHLKICEQVQGPSVLNIRVKILVVLRPLRVGAVVRAEVSDLFGWSHLVTQ